MMNPTVILAACVGGECPELLHLTSEDWQELRNTVFESDPPQKALLTLIESAKKHEDAIGLLIDLTSDAGFFLEVSRVFLSPASLDRFVEIGRSVNAIPWPEIGGERIVALARLLGSTKVWIWALGCLFSRPVISSLPSLVSDGRAKVRLQAVEALGDHQSRLEDRKAAFRAALTDSSKKVRSAAFTALSGLCTSDEIQEILDEQVSELSGITDRAAEARSALSGFLSGVPGLSALIALSSSGLGAATDAVGAAGRSAKSAVLGGFKRAGDIIRREEGETDEGPSTSDGGAVES